jgi:hypothetical protein
MYVLIKPYGIYGVYCVWYQGLTSEASVSLELVEFQDALELVKSLDPLELLEPLYPLELAEALDPLEPVEPLELVPWMPVSSLCLKCYRLPL